MKKPQRRDPFVFNVKHVKALQKEYAKIIPPLRIVQRTHKKQGQIFYVKDKNGQYLYGTKNLELAEVFADRLAYIKQLQIRTCIVCKKEQFVSTHNGHRMCYFCRSDPNVKEFTGV